jgi:hypothetical protein
MQVKILQRMGRKGHHPALRDAAHAFAGDLMKAPTHQRIKLRLELRKTTLPSFTLGVAWDMEREGEGFGVRIQRDMPFGAQLATLAHEMVHVSQMATGRLSLNGTAPVWLGTPMPGVPYKKQPWEVEARALAPALVDAHLRTLPLATRMRATWQSKLQMRSYRRAHFRRPRSRHEGPTIPVRPVVDADARYERMVGWFFSPLTWGIVYLLLICLAELLR